jgi:hypothetical protein
MAGPDTPRHPAARGADPWAAPADHAPWPAAQGAPAPGQPVAWSAVEAISYAWGLVTGHFASVTLPIVGLYLLSTAVGYAVTFGLTAVAGLVGDSVVTAAATLVGSLIQVALGLLFAGAATRFTLAAARGQRVELSELAGITPLLGRLVGFALLMSLAVLGGTLLLIIPGIIVAVALTFGNAAMVDEGLGAVAALKRSWQLSEGARLDLFLVYLLFEPILVVSLLACLIPALLVTMPMFYVAVSLAYLCQRGEVPVPPSNIRA